MIKNSFVLVLIGLLFVGCGGTTVQVSSVPAGAEVVMLKSGKRSTTNAMIKLDNKTYFEKQVIKSSSSEFKNSLSNIGKGIDDTARSFIDWDNVSVDSIGKAKYSVRNLAYTMTQNFKGNNELFYFRKNGHRDKIVIQKVLKSKENNVVATLDKVDTYITFNSTPQGATIKLSQDLLPEGWQREFKTPVSFKATSREAKALNRTGLALESVKLDGYKVLNLKTFSGSLLEAGKNKSINIKFSPITTTIRVMTEPEGATVEDITEGGFGYLGETPLVRNLTWSDISNWAERKDVKRTKGGFESIELNLRITKPEYKDAMMQGLKIPVGEERVFKRGLKRLAKEISFSTDPAGVHVYVNRNVIQDYYDEASGKVLTKTVPFNKHLGTTPFAYNIDPSKPLKHGDTLMFKKSGYVDTQMLYADGEDGFHMVLEPKVIQAR